MNLSGINWSILNVTDHWNALEDIIINAVDEEAPLKYFKVNNVTKFDGIPISIKQKINKRKRLLHS